MSDGSNAGDHRGVDLTLEHDGEGDAINLEDVASASWSQRETGEDVVRVEFTDGETDTYWAKNMVIASIEGEHLADEWPTAISRNWAGNKIEEDPDVSAAVSLCKGQCGVFSGWIDQCPECGADVRLMAVKDPEVVA